MTRARLITASAVLAHLLLAPALAQDAPEPGAQAAEYWDAEELEASRRALKQEHGGSTAYFILADRFEYQSNDGAPVILLDGQGWWGTDENRLWIKTEAEYSLNEDTFEELELQALWARPLSRYFNLQAGLRHDFEPGPSRSYAVVGVQGLAPYWFEIDASAFLSEKGDLSARLEAEYDMLLTQRLVLQPRAELSISAQDVDELGIGAGLTTAEAGLRLRYEFDRQFAPYLGVNWKTSAGKTADIVRASGGDVEAISLVAGIRVWF